jgi:chlorite dismutase
VVQALALGIDPVWRRRSGRERCGDLESLGAALAGGPVRTFTYSMIGLQPGADLLLWSLGPSLEAIEERASGILRSGLGSWCRVDQSLLGLIQGSQYVKRPTPQEQSLFSGERSRYLIVYPFTKSTEWYLLDQQTRQTIMAEHIRVGHRYPQVRQLLAHSFGVDDQDFLVAYETDDLDAFSRLVRELRGTESRHSTVSDTPILSGIHRDLGEIGTLLGAVP